MYEVWGSVVQDDDWVTHTRSLLCSCEECRRSVLYFSFTWCGRVVQPEPKIAFKALLVPSFIFALPQSNSNIVKQTLSMAQQQQQGWRRTNLYANLVLSKTHSIHSPASSFYRHSVAYSVAYKYGWHRWRVGAVIRRAKQAILQIGCLLVNVQWAGGVVFVIIILVMLLLLLVLWVVREAAAAPLIVVGGCIRLWMSVRVIVGYQCWR